MEKIKSNSIADIIAYTLLTFILIAIGWDIGCNMEFFNIDNPSVLVTGQLGVDGLITSIVHNPRLDFMYNIIIFLNAAALTNTPTVHFMIQFFFYVMTVFAALYFLRSYTNKKRIAVICVSLLVWCSSIGENLYTIGKKEIFMTFGMSVFLVCLYKLVCEEQSKKKRVCIYIAYIVAIVFAMTLKETSNIIVLTMIMLFFYVCVFKRECVHKILGSCLGLLAIVVLVQVYKKMFIINSNYTDYELTLKTIIDNMGYYLKYHADVCFVAVVGLVSSLILFYKDRKNERYAFLLISNLTGWGYVGGICLWRWTQSYYLYPAILFYAISLVSFFTLTRKKSIYVIFGLLYTVFALYGGNYNYRVAKSHEDSSIVYTDSIYSLDNIVESGGRIIIDDSDLYEEPVFQMKNLLNEYMGNDVNIYGGRQSIWETDVTDERLILYGYTREKYEEERESATLREGDYLVHYINDRNYYGAIRAINPAVTLNTISHLEEQGYILELLDEQLLDSKYFGWADGGFGLHNMQTGYQIYEVIGQKYKVTGVTTDGWSSQSIVIENYQKGMNCNIAINDIGTAINHQESNSIEILVDGEKAGQIEVNRGSVINLEQYLPAQTQGAHTIELIVKEIFVPSECNPDFNDTRELGVNIQLEEY